MVMKIRLLNGTLHYGPDVVLHTASSGSVPHLDELYLLIEHDREVLALGGIRRNIEYLTGISEAKIEKDIVNWASRVVWPRSFEDLLEDLHANSGLCAPACALLDQTFHDGIARARGVPLCELWGRPAGDGIETNQTLFWCDDETLIRRAETYVSRGFKTLKLRMGVGSFEADLKRLAKLRERFGDALTLSGDVNGQWPDNLAMDRISAVQAYDLAYLEQPVSASSWNRLEELAAQSPVKIMLDESASCDSDVERIISIGGQLAAHLKLIKFGGLRPLIAAGRRLIEAGIPVMVGQMNEGALATAAAAHAARVLGTSGNELYGADGIVDDPAQTPLYSDGRIFLSETSGIGPAFDSSRLRSCWERTIGTNIIDEPKPLKLATTGR